MGLIIRKQVKLMKFNYLLSICIFCLGFFIGLAIWIPDRLCSSVPNYPTLLICQQYTHNLGLLNFHYTLTSIDQ